MFFARVCVCVRLRFAAEQVTLYMNLVLPRVFFLCAVGEGSCTDHAAVDKRVATFYFWYDAS